MNKEKTAAVRSSIREKDIANLKARLKEYGYVVESMWTTDDARIPLEGSGVEITDEEAYEIVKKATNSLLIKGDINNAIEDELRDRLPRFARFMANKADEESE